MAHVPERAHRRSTRAELTAHNSMHLRHIGDRPSLNGTGILLAHATQVTQQGEADQMWKRDQSVTPIGAQREPPATVPQPAQPAGKSAEKLIMDLGTSV